MLCITTTIRLLTLVWVVSLLGLYVCHRNSFIKYYISSVSSDNLTHCSTRGLVTVLFIHQIVDLTHLIGSLTPLGSPFRSYKYIRTYTTHILKMLFLQSIWYTCTCIFSETPTVILDTHVTQYHVCNSLTLTNLLYSVKVSVHLSSLYR